MIVERLSIELTNLCSKGCWFCYNQSGPAGKQSWTVAQLLDFVNDCADNGTRAVSFGGGEPLEFEGLCELLRRLDGRLFRSITTNGLLLEARLDELLQARPDKVHISIHFAQRDEEVDRVIRQVNLLEKNGIASGVNLLVQNELLSATVETARRLRNNGIDNRRIVYLPLRMTDDASPSIIARVAGNKPFQSMSCLTGCAKSPRFCSVGWDKRVAWCSYTTERRRLKTLDHAGLVAALDGLALKYCGYQESIQ
jgi:molybdenum cofactor biosynthesis enzyme MoaA